MCLNRAGTLKGCNTSETLDPQDTHVSPVTSSHSATCLRNRLSRQAAPLKETVWAAPRYLGWTMKIIFIVMFLFVTLECLPSPYRSNSLHFQVYLICHTNHKLLGNSETSFHYHVFFSWPWSECLLSTDLKQSFLPKSAHLAAGSLCSSRRGSLCPREIQVLGPVMTALKN